MNGQWKEVAKLHFTGQRFQDHALDLSALAELSQFQKIVAETARALWKAEHPDRVRLPARFEERTRLCLRRIEEGSAVAPLEVFVEKDEGELFDPEPEDANRAVLLAYDVFEAAGRDAPLPERLPKDLVAEYAKWGAALGDDEEIEFGPPNRPPTKVNRRRREKLLAFVEGPYDDAVDITGSVLEADVKQQRFQLWLDERTRVAVVFSAEQEERVTTALQKHQSVRVRVRGRGQHTAQGRLESVNELLELTLLPEGEEPYDATARPIEDIISELAAEVPQEEWARVPKDLAENLDHYLYGAPRR